MLLALFTFTAWRNDNSKCSVYRAIVRYLHIATFKKCKLRSGLWQCKSMFFIYVKALHITLNMLFTCWIRYSWSIVKCKRWPSSDEDPLLLATRRWIKKYYLLNYQLVNNKIYFFCIYIISKDKSIAMNLLKLKLITIFKYFIGLI